MKNILIVGSGKTSRENVEALMDDHYYANKELTVHIAIISAPSEAQIWATQYTIDKQKTVKITATEGSNFMGIPTDVSRIISDSPIRSICESNDNLDAFVLWDDEDETCQNALAICSEFGISAFDLTNGLLPIKPVDGVKEVIHPKVNKVENITITEEQAEEILLNEPIKVNKTETSDDEDDEYEDALYEGFNLVAKIFAEAFARELKKVLGK